MIGRSVAFALHAGGTYLGQGEYALMVRGIGLLKTTEDIGEIVVAAQKGTPVRRDRLERTTVTTVLRNLVEGAGLVIEDQQRALARLYVIVPLVVFIIFIRLFGTFQSVADTLLIRLLARHAERRARRAAANEPAP